MTNSKNATDASGRSSDVAKAILILVEQLSQDERTWLLSELNASGGPPAAPPRKISEIMGVVLRLIPKAGDWSIEDLKKKTIEENSDTKPKDVYNAVAYLAKKGCIKRISYGRYLTPDGFCIESSDIVDAEPAHGESISFGD